MKYTLAFHPSEIASLARQYVDLNANQLAEDRIMKEIGPKVKRDGYYCKDDFLLLCHWKTSRTQKHCANNDDLFIREATNIALKTQNERLRIEVLTLLDGVEWPTASVLLHFGHQKSYPILDFRALESLSIPKPKQYSYPFWWEYVTICRALADQYRVSMRTLDRALWQYSKNREIPANVD